MPPFFFAVAIAVVGAALAYFFPRHIGPTLERFFGRKAVRATTELDVPIDPPRIVAEANPAVFEEGFPNWEAYGFVFEQAIDELGPPPSDVCREWRDWARARKGVDARWTKVQVAVEGRSEGQVLIDDFEVEVLSRSRALSGTFAECTVGGASGSPREIVLSLDHDPPRVRFLDPGDEPVKHFLFTLAKGEVETFRIYAVAERCCCEWIARFSYVADGRRQTVEINDGGEPFKTSGVQNAEQHTWTGNGWSTTFWDGLR